MRTQTCLYAFIRRFHVGPTVVASRRAARRMLRRLRSDNRGELADVFFLQWLVSAVPQSARRLQDEAFSVIVREHRLT